ncbi:sigma-70 family RNA polymerase sigma factor [Dactylosporangium sucinum]
MADDSAPLTDEAQVDTDPSGGGPAMVTAAKANDAKMQALYDAHAAALFQFLMRLTFGDRETALDLMQETMLRAWRNLDVLAEDVRSLRPWLYTVARRVAIDSARAKAARPQEVVVTDLTTFAAGDDEMERVVAVQTVRQAMTMLSEQHRSVIALVYRRGLSAADAAAVLGIPEGTVKSRTYYALRALREAIEGAGA